MDGSEYEPDPEYIKELDAVYLDVAGELTNMRLWLLADPKRRKTRRGIKRFIFHWVTHTCVKRPVVHRPKVLEEMDSPVNATQEGRAKGLADLKGVLK